MRKKKQKENLTGRHLAAPVIVVVGVVVFSLCLFLLEALSHH
jgi:hypothetical protein